MLTSYLVKCPNLRCDWFGSLLPSGDPQIWRAYCPATSIVTFECPQCHGDWKARVVGDDVETLTMEEAVAPLA